MQRVRGDHGVAQVAELIEQWTEPGDLTGKRREWAGGSVGAEPRCLVLAVTVELSGFSV
jgi:hypothetical protein